MNTYAKLAAAAAAVLVVVVVGYQFLPSNMPPGATTTPPSPTPAITAREMADGPLAAGTYLIRKSDRTLVPFTFTVGDGWSARLSDWAVTKRSGTAMEFGFTPFIVTHVYGDACNDAGTHTPVGPTVDDLVQALVDQKNSDASAPVDLTIGGYPAKRVDMSIPPGLDVGTCEVADILIRIWADANENVYNAIPADLQNTDAQSRVYIVDVGGQRVVITAGLQPSQAAPDIAELDAVIASIRFQP